MLTPQFLLPLADELVVDNFAGGLPVLGQPEKVALVCLMCRAVREAA